jgi:hypothetical protein
MKILLIITLLSVASNVFANDDRVKITVYYESYCPDSGRFLNGQLTRAYNEVRNITNIELVPFGKASVCKLIIKSIFFLSYSIFSLLLTIQLDYGTLYANTVLMNVRGIWFMLVIFKI